VAGAALMAGLLTRLSAAVSIGFSIMLMLMLGWQGATCIDEWTMAACNLAMGATLLLAGGGADAADNALLRRMPHLAQQSWFRWCAGSLPLPLSDIGVRRVGLAVLAGVMAFDIGTYSYYRGSVVTAFHSGPVSPTKHHFTLSDAVLLPDGGVRFHLYLDAGTAEAPAHVMHAALLAADGTVLVAWDNASLAALPAAAIRNDFAYNRVETGPYGLVATMGAMATVTLPAPTAKAESSADKQAATFQLTDIDGRTSSTTMTQKSG
ncbi:MAG TPA: TQO small subunit DoxA domain-containing protein, partial [Rhodopila sp.]|nr:TQO small subunit DoxA domain-containing protein [Rhodopila sp.]